MKPLKADVKAVAAALDQDHETVEGAATAAIEAAWRRYEARAKWAVVAQVKWPSKYLDQEDVDKSRVVLAPFATRKQAESAGESIAISASTGAEARWLAAEMWHDTPVSFYKAKVDDLAAQSRHEQTPAEKLTAIARERMAVLADLDANLSDPWRVDDDGNVLMDERAADRRLASVALELRMAAQDGRPPVISLSEGEALLTVLERVNE